MNETDNDTRVLLYGKDFFRDEVNLLISDVVIDFVVFLKRIDKHFYCTVMVTLAKNNF